MFTSRVKAGIQTGALLVCLCVLLGCGPRKPADEQTTQRTKRLLSETSPRETSKTEKATPLFSKTIKSSPRE